MGGSVNAREKGITANKPTHGLPYVDLRRFADFADLFLPPMAVLWDRESFTPVLGAKLLALLVVFRVLNALVVRTSFTPDEFWQGPEPAHLLAFGTGHL